MPTTDFLLTCANQDEDSGLTSSSSASSDYKLDSSILVLGDQEDPPPPSEVKIYDKEESHSSTLAEIARSIKEIVSEAKISKYPNTNLDSKIETLKRRSPTGHSLLLRLLRHEGQQQQQQQEMAENSSTVVEGAANRSSNSDSMDLLQLPDLLLSSTDLLVLEATYDSSPFSCLNDEVLPPPTTSKEEEEAKRVASDPDRRARFARTAEILSRSGLLDITMRTAELMKQNQQLSKELSQLRQESAELARDVLANPENAGLLLRSRRKSEVSFVPGHFPMMSAVVKRRRLE